MGGISEHHHSDVPHGCLDRHRYLLFKVWYAVLLFSDEDCKVPPLFASKKRSAAFDVVDELVDVAGFLVKNSGEGSL